MDVLNYGIVGNCKTCALIDTRGRVAWMCFPDFDSPSVFAKLLDTTQGGYFEIVPRGNYTISQQYVEHTNVLETVFESPERAFKVIDYFPRYKKLLPTKKNKVFKQNALVRIVKPIRGKNIVRVVYNPRLNYARGTTNLKITRHGLRAFNHKQSIYLRTNADYQKILNREPFELKGITVFTMGNERGADITPARCMTLLKATKKYWLRWVDTLVVPEAHKDIIIRSALTLKLLTYSETGAIIAAATTSVPEQVGTVRTWDYRFCWTRDSVFTVDALTKIGRDHEAKRLMEFIIDNSLKKKQGIHILYGIHGETELPEKKLTHLAGFKNTKPVRIGNEAYNQTQMQLDVYGELIDLMYLYYMYYAYEKKMTRKYWRFLTYLVRQIKQNWNREDSGIWEFRGIQKHYTYSKLMCYVGVDRAIRLAQYFDREKLVDRWLPLRERIREDVLKHGWNARKRAFTMYYGGDDLDATSCLFTYHEFLEYNDPRIIATIKRIYYGLRTGELVRRYSMKDDFGISKSAFIICSFWLVDALYSIGDVQKAKRLFEKLVKLSNHVGLYSEVADIRTKRLVGNFPQAYSHIALINSSILLSEWSAKRKRIDWETIPCKRQWF
jgi:GH15 family glucan-1,4-alpha-glucosidase